MKRVSLLNTIPALLLAFLLSSCPTKDMTSWIEGSFDAEFLNYETSVEQIDLSSGAQCPGTRVVNVVSKETRTEVQKVAPGSMVGICPAEFMRMASDYMDRKLLESRVRVDEKTGAEVHLWMEEVQCNGTFTILCNVKLKITIPEINYSGIYSGSEGAPNELNAMLYATNLAIVEFLKDPQVQQYIQCR